MRSRLALLPLVLAPLTVLACGSKGAPSGSNGESTAGPAAALRSAVMVSKREPVSFGDALPDEAASHVAISFRLQDEGSLDQLIADQQNPASPRYHAWLTPQQFGESFGLSEATYARVVDWMTAAGFSVTQYPNRSFVEGHGTAAGVRRLLGVQPRWATARGRTFRSYAEDLALPEDIAPLVAMIGGLDTRLHLRHHLDVTPFQSSATQALGAADMRALYDMPTTGTGASGLTLAILATQEGTQTSANGNPGAPFIPPSVDAIQTYLTSIANATVTYNPVVLPNTGNDFDVAGSNGEYQLDVEMQSVGAPNAKDIDLVLSPSSEVFQTGAQYIANTLSSAVAVSTSIGTCEPEEVVGDAGAATPGSEAYVFRAAVKQGVSEGQTWFAAAGDNGADDCADTTSNTKNGFGGGNATVDFPCSMPEIICMGGTQFGSAALWNDAGALTAWQTEVVWNEQESDFSGAGGGGQSLMYTKPSWQNGVGPNASDGARDVPDISLTAAIGTPGVAVYDCGSGQDKWSCSTNTSGAGAIDINGGTSIASPLAAGFFAHLAGQLGCRLGDIHATVYALGAAQQTGGAAPFHDMTSGNNSFPDPKNVVITGFTAGAGYDLASGWGSFDLAKLIDAWPACTGGDGGIVTGDDGGQGSGSGSGSGGSSGGDGGEPNGASGGGTASSGGGCTTAGASSSGAPIGAFLVGLGLVARLRRRGSRRVRS